MTNHTPTPKPTYIESARKIVEQKGDCCHPIDILCRECPFKDKHCGSWTDEYKLKEAEAYLAEHDKPERFYIGTCNECGIGGLHVSSITHMCADCRYEHGYEHDKPEEPTGESYGPDMQGGERLPEHTIDATAHDFTVDDTPYPTFDITDPKGDTPKTKKPEWKAGIVNPPPFPRSDKVTIKGLSMPNCVFDPDVYVIKQGDEFHIKSRQLSDTEKQILDKVREMEAEGYEFGQIFQDLSSSFVVQFRLKPQEPEWKVGDGFEYNGMLFMIVMADFCQYFTVVLDHEPSAGDFATTVRTFSMEELIKRYDNPVRIPNAELLALAAERAKEQ